MNGWKKNNIMKKVIKKNCRRPFPWFNLPSLVFLRKGHSYSITKQVMFTDSTIYHFNDNDQFDVNKLFGFSSGYAMTNSFRFGWRPNPDLTKIEVTGFEHYNGVMTPIISLFEVELNKWYTYVIKYDGVLDEVTYTVVSDDDPTINNIAVRSIVLKHNFNIGYKLYLYFGGNKKAPQDITIYINNK